MTLTQTYLMEGLKKLDNVKKLHIKSQDATLSYSIYETENKISNFIYFGNNKSIMLTNSSKSPIATFKRSMFSFTKKYQVQCLIGRNGMNENSTFSIKGVKGGLEIELSPKHSEIKLTCYWRLVDNAWVLFLNIDNAITMELAKCFKSDDLLTIESYYDIDCIIHSIMLISISFLTLP